MSLNMYSISIIMSWGFPRGTLRHKKARESIAALVRRATSCSCSPGTRAFAVEMNVAKEQTDICLQSVYEAPVARWS